MLLSRISHSRCHAFPTSWERTLDAMSSPPLMHITHIAKASHRMTAFSCEFGKFQFCFLPQGLKISPAVFQRVIPMHLAAVPTSNPYIDDILTGSCGTNTHLSDLRQFFEATRRSRLKFYLNKYSFFQLEIEFAGHLFTAQGVATTPSKIQDITKLALPQNVGKVCSLLGFKNFLHDHVPDNAAIVQHIQDLIAICKGKKKCSLLPLWNPLCQTALQK